MKITKKSNLPGITCFMAIILWVMTFYAITTFAKESESKKPEHKLIIKTDKEDAIYKAGDQAEFQIEYTVDGKPVDEVKLKYRFLENSFKYLPFDEVKFVKGKATVNYKWKKPAGVILRVLMPEEVKNKYGRQKIIMAGAACDPENIQASMPKPDDFDAFWDAKKALLDKMPFKPELKDVTKNSDKAKIEVYEITLNSINGSKVRGFFAKPKGKGPFPAVMCVHGAGTFRVGHHGVANYARKGAMAIDINPHDLPNNETAEFYKKIRAGKLKDYPKIGRESRETSYFLRMFCSCYRAAKYIISRLEWDKKHFVVHGSSQGGAQALATAYLCPEVTAFAAFHPAMCDHTGREKGRRAGWPGWIAYVRQKNRSFAPDPKQLEASRYYDGVNFATGIKGKALLSLGFVDFKCCPTAVYSAYNNLKGEKRIITEANLGHRSSPLQTEELKKFVNKELGLD